jgi:hypothetical protein
MIAYIKLTDEEDGKIRIETSYEFENDEERTGPVTNASFYGYTVDWLFKTGKIRDYAPEAEADLLMAQQEEDAKNNGE